MILNSEYIFVDGSSGNTLPLFGRWKGTILSFGGVIFECPLDKCSQQWGHLLGHATGVKFIEQESFKGKLSGLNQVLTTERS